jgi:hypothetical protein
VVWRSNVRVSVCVVAACATVPLWLGGISAAAGRQPAVRVASAASVTSGSLTAVACVSRRACTAVGSDVIASVFAQSWNGTRWSQQRVPIPAAPYIPALNAVSCTSTMGCTAVGSYQTGAGCARDVIPCRGLPLVARWEGTKWSLQRPVRPRGARFAALNGVSCTGGSACLAVGSWQRGPGCPDLVDVAPCHALPLVERWNGQRWSLQRAPSPPGVNGIGINGLNSVSCTSRRACTAVGSYATGSACLNPMIQGSCLNLLLAERWNGRHWSIQPVPLPAGGTLSTLSGVSCPTTKVCVAVGSYFASYGKYATLVERWNGTKWRIESTPNVSASAHDYLVGISCPTPRRCAAVGRYTDDFSRQETEGSLAERWNGTRWVIEPTPNVHGTGPNAGPTALAAVACAAPAACTAVGGVSVFSTVAERWNGTNWRIQPTP